MVVFNRDKLQKLRLGWCNINLEEPHNDNVHGSSWVHTGLEDLELIYCECDDSDTFLWEHFRRALKHFPSLETITIAPVDPECEAMELLKGDTPADGFPLLDGIHAACPSIKKLCISYTNATFLPAIPRPPSQELAKFRDLSHLTFSALYLDVESNTTSLVTLCKSCPRLQSLVIADFHLYGYPRDLAFCDVLVGFPTELADACAEGTGAFGTNLKDLTLEGKWGGFVNPEFLTETDRTINFIASVFFEWWETQHPFANLFGSAGISYKEHFSLFRVPMERRAQLWRLELEEERRWLAANAVQPE